MMGNILTFLGRISVLLFWLTHNSASLTLTRLLCAQITLPACIARPFHLVREEKGRVDRGDASTTASIRKRNFFLILVLVLACKHKHKHNTSTSIRVLLFLTADKQTNVSSPTQTVYHDHRRRKPRLRMSLCLYLSHSCELTSSCASEGLRWTLRHTSNCRGRTHNMLSVQIWKNNWTYLSHQCCFYF